MCDEKVAGSKERPPPPQRRRVVLVDDLARVRRELRVALELLEELEIVGEAENGAQAVTLVETLRPDVVVMDLEMPVLDGIAAAREIKRRHPECRVIALTIHDEPAMRQAAHAAGIDEFFEKGAPLAQLRQAITEEKHANTPRAF